MMAEVLCIGELLIDFFTAEINQSLQEATSFDKQAGGAPANVAAAIVSLGGTASFCGKVGNDAFGHFLEQVLREKGVSTKYLKKGTKPTTMAFVSRVTGGERDFTFVRGADEMLTLEDVPIDDFTAPIVHFGSATALLSSPFYDTYMYCMRVLKERGAFISFDPNFRIDLWKGRIDEYRVRVQECLAYADFIKMSEEEFDLTPFVPKQQWLAITKGKEGTLIAHGQQEQLVPSIEVTSVDTTGAGDAFVGAMLKQIADAPIADFGHFQSYTYYSNIVGALTCTQVGAMSALPTAAQVKERL